MRTIFWALAIVLLSAASSHAQEPQKKPAGKLFPPGEFAKLTPDELIRRFDKNNDGKLSTEEVPPFLAKRFKDFDRNQDSYLNREEMQSALQRLRADAPVQAGLMAGKSVEEILTMIQKNMDANQDGKIERAEAKGRMAENFDKIDLNKDGSLDRKELTLSIQQLMKKGPMAPVVGVNAFSVDFDAFDKNADGRLSRGELLGTRFEAVFTNLDTDGNGAIDLREFEAWLAKKK